MLIDSDGECLKDEHNITNISFLSSLLYLFLSQGMKIGKRLVGMESEQDFRYAEIAAALCLRPYVRSNNGKIWAPETTG